MQFFFIKYDVSIILAFIKLEVITSTLKCTLMNKKEEEELKLRTGRLGFTSPANVLTTDQVPEVFNAINQLKNGKMISSQPDWSF